MLCTHLRTEFCRHLEFQHITNQRLAYERRRAEYERQTRLTNSQFAVHSNMYDFDLPPNHEFHSNRRHSSSSSGLRRLRDYVNKHRRRRPIVSIDRFLPSTETVPPNVADQPRVFLHENSIPPHNRNKFEYYQLDTPDPSPILSGKKLPNFKVDALFTEFHHKKHRPNSYYHNPLLQNVPKWDTQLKYSPTFYNAKQNNHLNVGSGQNQPKHTYPKKFKHSDSPTINENSISQNLNELYSLDTADDQPIYSTPLDDQSIYSSPIDNTLTTIGEFKEENENPYYHPKQSLKPSWSQRNGYGSNLAGVSSNKINYEILEIGQLNNNKTTV